MRQLFRQLPLISKALLVAGVLALVSGAGAFVSPVVSEAQTTTVTEPTVECRLVERHTVQYVNRPVTASGNVRSVQKIPVKLRNFNDLEELKQWLTGVTNSTTTVYFQSPHFKIDCDDYALDLQHRALSDGYILSFQVISRNKYNAVFKGQLPPHQRLHAINLAIAGNTAYYIEPQTGEIVFAARLD